MVQFGLNAVAILAGIVGDGALTPIYAGVLELVVDANTAQTLAFIGSVISETVGGNNGIGFLMLSAGARNDAPTTFAGLFAIAIMGVLMYAICALIEKRMTRWAFRGELVG